MTCRPSVGRRSAPSRPDRRRHGRRPQRSGPAVGPSNRARRSYPVAQEVPLRPPAHRVHPTARLLWVARGAVSSLLAVGLVLGFSAWLPGDLPGAVELALAAARWLLVPFVL